MEAFALIKASSIILVPESEGARFSARNQLAGTVTRVQTGAVNTEVVLDLPGGGTIAAIITNQSAASWASPSAAADGHLQGVERDPGRAGLAAKCRGQTRGSDRQS